MDNNFRDGDTKSPLINEDDLIFDEELTTCEIHPGVHFEYFTDCPACMEDESMSSEYLNPGGCACEDYPCCGH